RQSVVRLAWSARACEGWLLEDPEDVLFLHDEELFPVDFHLAAGILPEEDAVPRLDGEGQCLPVLGHPAGTHRDDFALLGLLLGGVRDDDAAVLLVLFLEALDEDAVVERTQLALQLGCGSHRARVSFLQVTNEVENTGHQPENRRRSLSTR